uniref:NADH-ubiquinone oxidoreductase chain 2 n=2 Tax=Glyptotermes sp. 6 AB-2022a TaxID=2942729 RepID=A0A8X8RGB5_9NEOP|nr:NADH dehydrogenase subunit 2 [Glyptotermes sp. 6 AB-2022a]URX52968.1 NADH dehydrogenase subunit 2 [Glyptotermes sp. 6 AB-2022a]
MPNTPTKILLSTTLIGGILISISSNSWLGAWMGLEINLMSFIPLMSSQENIYTTEASLKYFLVQALASSSLLFLVVMKMLVSNTMITSSMHSYAVMTPLLMKMGAAPLHWWFPSVMEGLSWNNCLLMMTVQKTAPMMLMSYLMKMDLPTLMIILMSVTVGALGGMNQTSLRKILTYSSINHTGWMLAALLGSNKLWFMYFMVYSMLTSTVTIIAKSNNISFVNQTMTVNEGAMVKFALFTTLLSLGGLPPFMGFLPKWIVIQLMIANKLMFVMTVMVVTSLITLYYYLRVCYSSFIILQESTKWNSWMNTKNKYILYGVVLSMVSMMGLLMTTSTININ